jgi:hypothetical protein
MPLRYDPGHAIDWVPKAGTFAFEVISCEEMEFQTGSHGIRLQLAVEAREPPSNAGSSAHAPLRITDRIVFGERTTWKMRDLCRSTRVRFDPPCEAADLVGRRGRARFELDDREGLITLRVDRYLASRVGAERG